MIYTTKPTYGSEKKLWECNYEGALQSIEMARVFLLFLKNDVVEDES